MKRILPVLLLFFMISRCGSSSSSGTSGYVLQPNEATTFTTNLTSHTLNFNGTDYNCTTSSQCKAVIFNNTVNGTDYVGIGVTNDAYIANPATAGFNLKIYFPAPSIPSSITLNSGNSTIKVRSAGTNYVNTSGSITLTISGPDSNGIYTITSSPTSINIGATLTITSINALLVSSSLTSSD